MSVTPPHRPARVPHTKKIVPRIGVLALQGDFREHVHVLRQLGAEANEVRLPQHLTGLDGLILPGGESTTIGKLAVEYQLLEPLRDLATSGLPMWGTCAGLILLARDAGRGQPLIGALDVSVQRNAFGRQVDSFEADLRVPVLVEPQRPFRSVFIRAPLVTRVGPDVEVLARLDNAGTGSTDYKGNRDEQSQNEMAQPPTRSSSIATATIVAVRQGCLLGTAFHPELTGDDRFHRYFLTLIDR